MDVGQIPLFQLLTGRMCGSPRANRFFAENVANATRPISSRAT